MGRWNTTIVLLTLAIGFLSVNQLEANTLVSSFGRVAAHRIPSTELRSDVHRRGQENLFRSRLFRDHRVSCSEDSSSNSKTDSKVNIIPQERKDALIARFEKKYGVEEAKKVLPKVFELELQMLNITEKERTRRISISISNAGKKPWNTGRKHSPEMINKIRERTIAAMQRPGVVSKLRKKATRRPKQTRQTNSANPKATRSMRKRQPRSKETAEKAARTIALKKKTLSIEKGPILARLQAGRGHVRRRIKEKHDWSAVGNTATIAIRKRIIRDLTGELFENHVSEQQLEDLEELVTQLSELHRADTEMEELKHAMEEIDTDPAVGLGAKAMLKEYIVMIKSAMSETTKFISAAFSRLPELEEVKSVVEKWIEIHKSKSESEAIKIVAEHCGSVDVIEESTEEVVEEIKANNVAYDIGRLVSLPTTNGRIPSSLTTSTGILQPNLGPIKTVQVVPGLKTRGTPAPELIPEEIAMADMITS